MEAIGQAQALPHLDVAQRAFEKKRISAADNASRPGTRVTKLQIAKLPT